MNSDRIDFNSVKKQQKVYDFNDFLKNLYKHDAVLICLHEPNSCQIKTPPRYKGLFLFNFT